MSRTTTFLAAALGCVLLFAFWLQSGEETPAAVETASPGGRSLSGSKSAFPEPQRPRSLNRQDPASDAKEQAQPADDAIEERDEVVVKNRVEPRAGSIEERQATRRGQRDARLEAKRAERREGGRLAGVVPQGQGQLSRRAPESGGMAKVEQPPLRQPEPVEDEVDEDSLDHLREVALSDPDPDERADAISQLDLEDPAAMDVLIKALEDSDPDVRLAALDELWTNSDEPPLDILARVMHDTDPEVRLEAVRILSESEEPYAQQLLRAALLDRNEEVREEAADALDEN